MFYQDIFQQLKESPDAVLIVNQFQALLCAWLAKLFWKNIG
jgi:hypothetical protein